MPHARARGRLMIVGLSSNVLESHTRFGAPDGIGTYTAELETALAAAGAEVRRIGSPVRIGMRFERPAHASLAFPLPLSYLVAAASAMHTRLPFATKVERAIDVYHATDYLVPRLSRTPVVATLYDAIPLAHPEWANPRLRSVKNWLLRRCAQSSDLIIAISHAAAEELIEHYDVSRDRIRVVPLGVHARWFERPNDEAIAAALTRHRLNRGYLLHVGTVQPRKNLDALLAAYEMLPPGARGERQLVLVGKYGWGAETLRARLERLKAAGRVVWLDYVDRNDLPALYYAAGMFLYPSLAEGFGLPLLEALACGVPTIANDLPVLREVAGRQASFVDATKPEAIASAIALMDSSGDADVSSHERREHARTFSWSTCALRSLDVYREVAR